MENTFVLNQLALFSPQDNDAVFEAQNKDFLRDTIGNLSKMNLLISRDSLCGYTEQPINDLNNDRHDLFKLVHPTTNNVKIMKRTNFLLTNLLVSSPEFNELQRMMLMQPFMRLPTVMRLEGVFFETGPELSFYLNLISPFYDFKFLDWMLQKGEFVVQPPTKRCFHEARHILSLMLKTTKELHDFGIMHGDLKFDNVMIKTANAQDFSLLPTRKSIKHPFIPVMIDFEHAYDTNNPVVGEANARGTPGFMAPELRPLVKPIEGQEIPQASSIFSTKVDIYSIGAMFYRLFCVSGDERLSRKECSADNVINTNIQRIINSDFKHDGKTLSILDVISCQVKDATVKCLDSEQDNRPNAFEILKNYSVFGDGDIIGLPSLVFRKIPKILRYFPSLVLPKFPKIWGYLSVFLILASLFLVQGFRGKLNLPNHL